MNNWKVFSYLNNRNFYTYIYLMFIPSLQNYKLLSLKRE